MKSLTLPSFWKAYNDLDKNIQTRAKKAFKIWMDDPFYPSLHFKCIHSEENIWSLRVTLNYRAVGIWEGDQVIWFWIGSHDDYTRMFS